MGLSCTPVKTGSYGSNPGKKIHCKGIMWAAVTKRVELGPACVRESLLSGTASFSQEGGGVRLYRTDLPRGGGRGGVRGGKSCMEFLESRRHSRFWEG